MPGRAAAQAEHPWPRPATVDMPSGKDLKRLQSGEVLLESMDTRHGGAARVQAIFMAKPEAIWDKIASCETNFIYIDGLRECEVLELSPTYSRTRQVIKKNWFTPAMDFTFEARRTPYSHIEFRLVSGDLKKMSGSWVLTPMDQGRETLLTHVIELQPSLPAPRWLVRSTLVHDLPDMVACLRWLAHGSLTPKQVPEDRDRCPNPPAKN